MTMITLVWIERFFLVDDFDSSLHPQTELLPRGSAAQPSAQLPTTESTYS